MLSLLRLMMIVLCLSPMGVGAEESEASASADVAQVEEVQPVSDLNTQVETMVSNLLKAYNDQDSGAFYKDFAESMASISTPEAFKALYTDIYMETFGAFVSKELNQEETVMGGENPVGLMVYKANFEKASDVKISVNLILEGSSWKLMQVQFTAAAQE
ncbi:MAG: hypothetical protein H3C47_12030 [Candidatus Cloacimonetes bacterium]|nr:hypothetical protein [Candidatus Cloacimonadota bacterium]